MASGKRLGMHGKLEEILDDLNNIRCQSLNSELPASDLGSGHAMYLKRIVVVWLQNKNSKDFSKKYVEKHY